MIIDIWSLSNYRNHSWVQINDVSYNIIPSLYMFYRNQFVHRQRRYHYNQTQHLQHKILNTFACYIKVFLTIDNGFDRIVEYVFLSCIRAKDLIKCICLLYVFSLRWVNKWNMSRHNRNKKEKLTFNLTEVPSSSMSMMGCPPSLISSLFCGRKRQTTLMLFPDIYNYDGKRLCVKINCIKYFVSSQTFCRQNFLKSVYTRDNIVLNKGKKHKRLQEDKRGTVRSNVRCRTAKIGSC